LGEPYRPLMNIDKETGTSTKIKAMIRTGPPQREQISGEIGYPVPVILLHSAGREGISHEARLAGNGKPLSRAATRHGRIWGTLNATISPERST